MVSLDWGYVFTLHDEASGGWAGIESIVLLVEIEELSGIGYGAELEEGSVKSYDIDGFFVVITVCSFQFLCS